MFPYNSRSRVKVNCRKTGLFQKCGNSNFVVDVSFIKKLKRVKSKEKYSQLLTTYELGKIPLMYSLFSLWIKQHLHAFVHSFVKDLLHT